MKWVVFDVLTKFFCKDTSRLHTQYSSVCHMASNVARTLGLGLKLNARESSAVGLRIVHFSSLPFNLRSLPGKFGIFVSKFRVVVRSEHCKVHDILSISVRRTSRTVVLCLNNEAHTKFGEVRQPICSRLLAYTVTLTFDSLTLNVCSISAVM